MLRPSASLHNPNLILFSERSSEVLNVPGHDGLPEIMKSSGVLNSARKTGSPARRVGLCLLWVALICLGNAQFAYAHDPGLSTATFQLETSKLEAVLVFSLLDAGQIVEMDKDHDGRIAKDELTKASAELQQM